METDDRCKVKIGEADLFTARELTLLNGFLKDEAWPLVVRLIQAMARTAMEETLDPAVNFDGVNRARGYHLGLTEFLGVVSTVIPAMYKSMVEANEQRKQQEPTEGEE